MSRAELFSKDDFIARALVVHGDAYDYSHVIYRNNSTPVRIDCRVPEHGPFWQVPGNHCRGNGCPACGGERRVALVLKKTAEKVFAKIKEIHGDAYRYDDAIYAGAESDLKIHCPMHGDFIQKASLHLSGAGCPECDRQAGGPRRRRALMLFLRKAAAVHGATYDYSKVRYDGFQTKVEIICRKHGSFSKAPTHHLTGSGCPACGMERSGAVRTDGLATFIEKAIARHGEGLDYSEVEYVNSRTKVKISCGIHGSFLKTPAEHLSGAGCPTCGLARRGHSRRD